MTEQDDTPEKFIADLQELWKQMERVDGNTVSRAEALFAKERQAYRDSCTESDEHMARASRLQAVAALDESFGYEQHRFASGAGGAWYCRFDGCDQKKEDGHLDGCPVGRYEEYDRATSETKGGEGP